MCNIQLYNRYLVIWEFKQNLLYFIQNSIIQKNKLNIWVRWKTIFFLYTSNQLLLKWIFIFTASLKILYFPFNPFYISFSKQSENSKSCWVFYFLYIFGWIFCILYWKVLIYLTWKTEVQTKRQSLDGWGKLYWIGDLEYSLNYICNFGLRLRVEYGLILHLIHNLMKFWVFVYIFYRQLCFHLCKNRYKICIIICIYYTYVAYFVCTSIN